MNYNNMFTKFLETFFSYVVQLRTLIIGFLYK